MFSIFLQNLFLILATLLVLVNHKADYTLYMAIAAIVITSFRMMFTNGSASTKTTYFLIQGLIFSISVWYVMYPRQFAFPLV